MAILHIKIKAILLRNRFFAHRQRGVYVLIPKRSGRAKDFEFVAGQQRQAAQSGSQSIKQIAQLA